MFAESDSDEMSIEEIIRRARDDEGVVTAIKQTPNKALKALVPKSKTGAHYKIIEGTVPVRKRKMRCKSCEGCLAKDCGKCGACKYVNLI